MTSKILIVLATLVAASLACSSGPATERPSLYPSPTVQPTQTAWVQVIQLTSEPVVVEITSTPVATQAVKKLCVVAIKAAYLRPSPSLDNYPITEVLSGGEIIDLGGRSGGWWFVQHGDKQGWMSSIFIGDCENNG
jgi:hypothetical protein